MPNFLCIGGGVPPSSLFNRRKGRFSAGESREGFRKGKKQIVLIWKI